MLPNLILEPPKITINIIQLQEPETKPYKLKPIKHKVKPGDTLEAIAEAHHTTIQRLFDKNKHIDHPDIINVGEVIVVPLKDEKLKQRVIISKSPSGGLFAKLDKPSYSGGFSSSNSYQPGQCTHWVASQRYVPNGWGNATNWKSAALKAGWTVSKTPKAGAIGWRWGHVVYIVSVNKTSVTISEQNYDWRSSIRTIDVPLNEYEYIY